MSRRARLSVTPIARSPNGRSRPLLPCSPGRRISHAPSRKRIAASPHVPKTRRARSLPGPRIHRAQSWPASTTPRTRCWRAPRQTADQLAARASEIAGTFDAADQKLVARAVETAQSLAARAGDILRNFEGADERLSVRIGKSAEALAARASDLGRVFDAADQQLISRIAEGSEALSARASEIGRIFDEADHRLVSRIADSTSTIGEHADNIVGAFASTEQRVAERARQTGQELAVHAREIEQALAGADERLASSAAAAAARVEGRGCRRRKPSRLHHRNDRPEAQRAGFDRRGAAHFARQLDRRNLHCGRPAYRPEHQRRGEDHRHQHPRAQHHAGGRSAEITKILDETARPLVERFAQGGSNCKRAWKR